LDPRLSDDRPPWVRTDHYEYLRAAPDAPRRLGERVSEAMAVRSQRGLWKNQHGSPGLPVVDPKQGFRQGWGSTAIARLEHRDRTEPLGMRGHVLIDVDREDDHEASPGHEAQRSVHAAGEFRRVELFPCRPRRAAVREEESPNVALTNHGCSVRQPRCRRDQEQSWARRIPS
jgi:hypothetical protein